MLATIDQIEHDLKDYNVEDMTSVDVEREKVYKMGEEINAQLDYMDISLKDLVRKLNEAQENSMDKSNPMTQILKVLSTHFTTLQWIDQSAASLQAKLKQVARLQETNEERFSAQQRR
jgi:nuclear pore complex protein Nup62